MNEQQGRLLSLPAEIRRQIWTHALSPGPRVHLTLHGGHPYISPCLGAELGYEALLTRAAPVHYRRLPSEDRDALFYMRIMSRWANHFLCEEARSGVHFKDHPVLEKQINTDILVTCKQMYVTSSLY